MQNRRTFLSLAAASWLPGAAAAQTPTATPPRELARHTLTGPLESLDAVLLELRPGPGPAQIVPAGGTFFEPTGALHSTWESADPAAPARVLVFMVVPKGTSGTTAA